MDSIPQVDTPRLSDQDTIDYHLQTILAARLNGMQFEVINAAVSEYRLFQEVTLFHEKLVNFRPNLIIFLDGHNDISFLTGRVTVKDHPNPYWDNRHFIRAERVFESLYLAWALLLSRSLSWSGQTIFIMDFLPRSNDSKTYRSCQNRTLSKRQPGETVHFRSPMKSHC